MISFPAAFRGIASRSTQWKPLLLLAAIVFLAPAPALGHAFVAPYALPVPFAIYAYAASAALILSFVASAILTREASSAVILRKSAEIQTQREALAPQVAIGLARAVSVGFLVLAIVSGLFGTKNPFRNFNMTFFWIVIVLGLTYLIALIGNVYRLLNPWLNVCLAVDALSPGFMKGRFLYPGTRAAYYPALAFFVAFICLELFGHTNPRSLAIALLAYSVLTIAGAFAYGMSWLRRGEVFSVFFEMISRTSPLDWRASTDGRVVSVRWRRPFSGLVGRRVHLSLTIFVLFMLSSTAFDGIHETVPWSRVYWGGVYNLYKPMLPANSLEALSVSTHLYYAWQWVTLCLSPFLYLLVFIAFLALSGAAGGVRGRTSELTSRFALTLIPIAIVYHLSHYFTMLIGQAPQIAKLMLDPFGFGWNLFGSKAWEIPPFMIAADVIWHVQVASIVVGHIVSVYVAHLEAMKIFGGRKAAARSQVPMLGLMMVFTTFGLWILSLPLGS